MCLIDDWMTTHLPRFVYYAKQHMPYADLYLVIPIDEEESQEKLAAIEKALAPFFAQVLFVPKQGMTGRLVFFDWLRADLTSLLNLKECLYIDVDTDILEDLADIPTLSNSDLLWVENPVCNPEIFKGLESFGLSTHPPYMEPGLIYMRRSFKSDFEEILTTDKVDLTGFVPGSLIWNIITQKARSFKLPSNYNTTSGALNRFFSQKTLHFTGDLPKRWRLHLDYETSPDLPGKRRLLMRPKPVEYTGVDFSGLKSLICNQL